MIRRLLMVPVATLFFFTTGSGAFADDGGNNLIAANVYPAPLAQPAAPQPSPDILITPPGEVSTFPMRPDGQPFVLNIDESINMTDALNRYYYNPRWRGEEWGPVPWYWIPERMVRMMPSWEEYDQQNIFRLGNRWAKFFEKYSGFGP